MARRPLSQFADQDDLLSEEAQYVLREAKQWCQMLTSRTDTLMETVEALQQAVNLLSSQGTSADTTNSLNILGSKIDNLKDALVAIAEKLDSEDVTNLDTDYAAEVAANLT